MSMSFRVTCLVFALATLATQPANSLATTKEWSGVVSNEFDDPDNWSPVGMPGASDVALFHTLGHLVSVDASRGIGGLLTKPGTFHEILFSNSSQLTANAGNAASLEMTGGALTLNAGGFNSINGVLLGSTLAPATLTLTSGHRLVSPETTITERFSGSTLIVNQSTADLGATINNGFIGIENGSVVDTSSANLAGPLFSGGSVVVQDPGSVWNGSGPTRIGVEGWAITQAITGGWIQLDTVDAGIGPTSIAGLFVDNFFPGEDRSRMSATDVRLAIESGDASLEILGGAVAQFRNATMGVKLGSRAAFQVGFTNMLDDGGIVQEYASLLEVAETVVVGLEGSASGSVFAQGVLRANDLELGKDSTADGRIEFIDAGVLDVDQHVTVGDRGLGRIDLLDRSQAYARDMTIGARQSGGIHGIGLVRIVDVGSSLNITEDLIVGDNGLGRLEIQAGGEVHADHVEVAKQRAALLGVTTGTVSIQNPGSSLVAAGSIYVGVKGDAYWTTADGAYVEADEFLITQSLGSEAFAEFRDFGTQLVVHDSFKIGPAGFGEALFEHGATGMARKIRVANRGGDIAPIGSGRLEIRDHGTELTATEVLSIGGNGPGHVELAGGGLLNATTALVGMDDPEHESQKGSINLDFATLQSNHVEVFETGTISGNGDIRRLSDPLTVINRGVVRPGATTLNVEGGFTQSPGGTMQIDIGGPNIFSDFGVMFVGETAEIAGTLLVELVGPAGAAAYSPALGDKFPFLNASVVTGEFDNVELPSLDPGLFWEVDYLANTVELNIADSAIYGDFNRDGSFDLFDLDELITGIASGSDTTRFDLNDDGLVDLLDRDRWLETAGSVELESGNAYLPGDVNLDGDVNDLDIQILLGQLFTNQARWSSGDLNADGFVDASDFDVWNEFRFLSANGTQAFVPEPHPMVLVWLSLIAMLLLRKRYWKRLNTGVGLS